MNIKNTLKSLSLFFFGLAAVSCSDNTPGEPEESTKETMLKSAAQAYVSHTVLPTYKGMADAAIELYDNCEIISQHHAAGALTTADIAAAANAWKESRRYWELSDMRAAIDNAISAIAAIPEPFALNAAGAEAANAVEVVGDNLVATLEKVYSELSKQ